MFLPKINLPNKLVLLRIVAAVVVIALFVVLDLENFISRLVIATIFGAACFTDWLDGHLARTLEQKTVFGEVFDPLADKVLVTSILIFLALSVAPWLVAISLCVPFRDYIVNGIRLVHAKTEYSPQIAADRHGKIKTAVQMSIIPVAILAWHPVITIATVIISAALAVWSGFLYVRSSKIQLK